MGRKRPRPRRSFTPEFKAGIVELCRRGDRSVGQVAGDFDLSETAVRDWVRRAEVDADEREGLTSSEREGLTSSEREGLTSSEREGLTSSEREEPARLRRENRRLRENVEVLERATAFFATETQ